LLHFWERLTVGGVELVEDVSFEVFIFEHLLHPLGYFAAALLLI